MTRNSEKTFFLDHFVAGSQLRRSKRALRHDATCRAINVNGC